MHLNNIDCIPAGISIIIDTNIIIYAVLAHPVFGQLCRKFLKRIEAGEIIGYLPTVVMNEVVHKFVISELIERKVKKSTTEVLHRLKNDHEIIRTLQKTWIDIEYLYSFNCLIVSEKPDTFKESLFFIKEHQLMAKDAYIVAFAQSYNLSHIASNDRDFRRIPWLSVWHP